MRSAVAFSLVLVGCGRTGFDANASDCGTTDGTAISMTPTVKFIQGAIAPVTGSLASTAQFAVPQKAGDLNVVVVSWQGVNNSPISVSDSASNAYQQASATTVQSLNGTGQAIYYAPNILAGSVTVTVTFGVITMADVRILEYAGLATTDPVDATHSGLLPGGGMLDSGPVVTLHPHDLLLAANAADPSAGQIVQDVEYNLEILTAANSLVEDREVFTAGTYMAGATQSVAHASLLQIVAFKAN